MSLLERTGWRDQALSARHRMWGTDCPAVDLDFVLVEYSRAAPCALVDYKHHAARSVDLAGPSHVALAGLAGSLPLLVVRYGREPWWWFVVRPANAAAVALIGPGQAHSEASYVSLLHALRGLQAPEWVLGGLDDQPPPPDQWP